MKLLLERLAKLPFSLSQATASMPKTQYFQEYHLKAFDSNLQGLAFRAPLSN